MSRSAEPGVLFIANFQRATRGFAMPCFGVASRLEEDGWSVIRSSQRTSRAERLLDMVLTAWRRRREYEIASVDVFSGLAFVWAEAACLSLRAAGRPYVLSLHGGRLPQFAERCPGRVRRLLGGARAVVAPSHYLVETMRKYRSDIQLIPNALALSDFPFRRRGPVAPRLIWVRSFHRIYNPSLAVRVLAALRADIPDVRLTMVGPDKGDGALEATRREIAELGLEGVVDFAGAVAHEEIAQYLAGADIFLNTTDVDNTPVSVLEAMACGMCVVSTDVGGLPYLPEDGRTALLVPRESRGHVGFPGGGVHPGPLGLDQDARGERDTGDRRSGRVRAVLHGDRMANAIRRTPSSGTARDRGSVRRVPRRRVPGQGPLVARGDRHDPLRRGATRSARTRAAATIGIERRSSDDVDWNKLAHTPRRAKS